MEYKRKHEGRTNYRRRLGLLASGKPRLVIRKSLRNIIAQVVTYNPDGDKTIVSAHSKELINVGYSAPKRNLPTAYLVGVLLAKKAQKKSIREVIPDIGFYPAIKGSLMFSVIKGVKDGGLVINFDETIMPDDKRIGGEHIVQYALHNPEKFSHYGMDPTKVSVVFNEVKKNLLEKWNSN